MPKLIRCGDTVLLLSLPFTERNHTTIVVCRKTQTRWTFNLFLSKIKNRLFTNHLFNTEHIVKYREYHVFSYFIIWRITASTVILTSLRKPSLKIVIYLEKRGMLAPIKLLQGWTEGHNTIYSISGRWNTSWLWSWWHLHQPKGSRTSHYRR